MTDPATFEPLRVTGYEIKWDEREAPEGEHFEHARIDLPNNYSVSVARASMEPASIGYEDGLWEAALMRPLPTDDVRRFFGQSYENADDLADLTTHDVEGFKIVGNLDNAGIQALVETVATRPTYEVPETGQSFEDILGGLDLSEDVLVEDD